MAGLSLTFSIIGVLFFFSVLSTSDSAAAATPTVAASSFIKTSCRATTYPSVCVRSLSTYASTIQTNHKQLMMTALSLSLDTAQSTKKFVYKLSKSRNLKPKEYAAIKDCLEEVNDSVDMLSKSVQEFKSLGRSHGPELTWHMSNLQTWVSAALTDYSSCVDGLASQALDGRTMSSIKARMTNVAQATSNALALCNQFAPRN